MARKIIKLEFSAHTQIQKPSYIRRIPAELLAVIFIFSIPWGNDYRTRRKLNQYPLPLLLVCRSWKEAALRTPDLWTLLVLNCHRVKPALVGPRVKTWFSRAKDKPLSLTVNLKTGGFLRTGLEGNVPWSRLTMLEVNNDFALPFDVARSALMCCTNLETCRLGGIDGWSKKKAMPSTQFVTLPLLRSLTIEFESTGSQQENCQTDIHWLFLPLILPRLEKLEMRATQSYVDGHLIPTLLKVYARSKFSLTHLHLSRITPICEDLCKLFQVSPSIHHLHLEGTVAPQLFSRLLGNVASAPADNTVILPSLEELVVIDSSPTGDWLAWDNVSLKFLESRSWNGRKYPYEKSMFSKLRDVAIMWKSESCFPSRGNVPGEQRAKRLRDNGMLLFYPTLGVSRHESSKLKVDFWWL